MTPARSISIEISEDRLVARLVIREGVDPEAINEEEILERIAALDIEATDEVRARVATIIEERDPETRPEVAEPIAEGRKPVAGVDGKLEWEPGYDPTGGEGANEDNESSSDESKVEHSDEPIDYRERRGYTVVNEGDHVATITAPTPYEPGVTVDGQILEAREGAPVALSTDDSVRIDKDGRIFATQSGSLRFEHGMLRVDPLLLIEGDVDYHTGHIEFDGPVVVQGDVRDCFRIECKESLVVEGVVEAADITVDGAAEFRIGMAGRERGQVRVTGDLRTGYLEHARVRTGGGLFIERGVYHSQLDVEGAFTLERGPLVGGIARIRRRVTLQTLGAESGVPTEIIIGGAPELSRAVDELQRGAASIREQREAAIEARDQLVEKAGDSPVKRVMDRLEELESQIHHFDEWLEQISGRLNRALQLLQRDGEVDLEVATLLNQGVIVGVAGRRYRFRAALRGPLRIHTDAKGRPSLTDMRSNSTTPLSTVATPLDDEAEDDQDDDDSAKASPAAA
ncbi:MAG: DUF342 domain-containing protein [Phycisphaerales bacterium]